MAFTCMKTAVVNQASKTESKWPASRPVGTGIPITPAPIKGRLAMATAAI